MGTNSGLWPLCNITMTGQSFSCEKTASGFQVTLILGSTTVRWLILPPFFLVSLSLLHCLSKDSIRGAEHYECNKQIWGQVGKSRSSRGSGRSERGHQPALAPLSRLMPGGKSEAYAIRKKHWIWKPEDRKIGSCRHFCVWLSLPPPNEDFSAVWRLPHFRCLPKFVQLHSCQLQPRTAQ